MKSSDFDYYLPPHLIAQTPIEPRDASRLMVLSKSERTIEHRHFRDIVAYLQPSDLLVCNDSRVIPARLYGHKIPTGGKVELLLLHQQSDGLWEALVRGRKVRVGTKIAFEAQGLARREGNKGKGRETGGSRLVAEVMGETEAGGRLIRFDRSIEPFLDEIGVVPLPPYIHKPLEDAERYQTVYARVKGSAAAPTAGLHFTPELMAEIEAKGVEFAFVTLHIGLDTFRPVREERIEDHRIHSEYCELSPQVATQVNRAKSEGRRVIAVGTSSVRVLETAAGIGKLGNWETRKSAFTTHQLTNSQSTNLIAPFSGWTDLFIHPGYRFRVVDALITNFHLPRSTLLMLVAAFAGKEFINRAYQEAFQEEYRFYSFGDAMFIYR